MEPVSKTPDGQTLIETHRHCKFIEASVSLSEKTIRRWDPYFCNLKFVLIFLVILGHLIEKHIYVNHYLYIIYTVIYMVHMPLFAFVSGYFSKNSDKKLNRIWRIGGQLLILHLGWLLINLFLTGGLEGWKSPYWYFWYLLSLFCWKWMGILILSVYRRLMSKGVWVFRPFIIVFTIVIGCFSGGI